MIGISWRREQGLADPLLKRLVEEAGLDDVPQWTRGDNVRARAHAKWMGMAVDRDGAVAAQARDASDVAAITAEIREKALALGADLVGCCGLTPIMIDADFDLPHRNAVAIVVHEDYANALKGSRAIEAETYAVYVRVAQIATDLSAYIRDMGFPAWAHHNGVTQIQAIPTLYHCGMGELGRNGSLINPTYSANFRPSFVTTNLPLEFDSPLVYGVQDTCENCNLCRNNCPGDAIATDHIVTEGVKRWRIDMEKCYPYSRLHEAYCHICVDVCPYVQKENRDPENRRMYKAFMKQRREDGYRSPNRL
ncbi:MAG: 4Fe-4S dicluster domain-containing protein [Rhodospirillales bacterium]|nr:4Fe-4S dicluster domain-containing protein [Rhodospirillales bacterium]